MAATETQLPSSLGSPPEKKQKGEIDCEQCGLVKSKYTCPKCGFRSCSLACVKLHKEEKNCDGQRQPFDTVKKFSQFNDNVSIKDQEYLNSLKGAVSGGIRSTNAVLKAAKETEGIELQRKRPYPEESPVTNSEQSFDTSYLNNTTFTEESSKADNDTSIAESHPSQEDEDNEFLKKHGRETNPNTLTVTERYLISAAVRRRIFITVNSPADANGSRHEQHSDIIIWTVGLKFMQEIPDQEESASTELFTIDTGDDLIQENGYTITKGNKIVEYDCTTTSIPENLTVNTLIRQYVKPKQFGTVVSKKDLDEEKMQPFWDAGLDNVLVFMRVPVGDKERYYMVDKSKPILDNLRNRYVNGYPKFIIVLPAQFQHWQTLSEMEAQELHDERRIQNKVRHQHDGPRDGNRNNNFNRRGGQGNRGRGGFRGGRGGNRGRGRGDRGGRNNREYAPRDLSDIFEPFPSSNPRISRPEYANNSNDAAMRGWNNAINKRKPHESMNEQS